MNDLKEGRQGRKVEQEKRNKYRTNKMTILN